MAPRRRRFTGETAENYILSAADEGKTIKVQVSFADNAGNSASLTSAAVGPVVPAVDTTAPRVTSIERWDRSSSPTNSDTLS